jgi:predicted amidohydrolase
MFSEKGAVEQNLKETSRHIEEAHNRGIDIIAFPEASITGYNDRGKFPEAIEPLDGEAVAAFLTLTQGKNLTALAGVIEHNPAGKPYITHVVARNGSLAGFYRKTNIIDEDSEWITPGNEIKVFDHNGIVYGIAVCSDIEKEEIFAECARLGAKIVFELAAPGLYGEQATRDWKASYEWWEGVCKEHLSKYAKKYGLWIPVATQAGRTCDEDFPGGGYLFSPTGERVYSTKDWQPCVSYLEIDFEKGTAEEIQV